MAYTKKQKEEQIVMLTEKMEKAKAIVFVKYAKFREMTHPEFKPQ